jgi:wyosine [tRNA(Phe)-imidazoG37] synthetase (radical SAM superfamily)
MFKNGDKVQACCETYQDQFDPAETIAKTANDPIMRQLRLDLLDPDVVPKICWKCETREKYQPEQSVRKNALQLHDHWTEQRARDETNSDGSVDNFRLEHLDIRWSNLCNYKCRFCGIQSSNLWLKENKMIYGDDLADHYDPKTGISEYNMDWEDLKTHLPYIRYCKLAGGEPTIMPGTYQLLEELIRVENKNCWISLITNGTTIQYGKYNLLELLKHFRGVRIQLSMEGMGDRHAWARSGKDDWHLIEKNIEQFQAYTKEFGWKMNFHTGISWMNMYHLGDFILQYPNTQFIFNMVTQPEEMSIMNFYKSDLQKCILHYEKLLENSPTPIASMHLSKVKKALQNAIDTTDESIDMEKFKRIHNMLDDNRKQNFALAYPEWSHLYA